VKVFVIQSNDGRWIKDGVRGFGLTKRTELRQCYASLEAARGALTDAWAKLKARVLALAIQEVEI